MEGDQLRFALPLTEYLGASTGDLTQNPHRWPQGRRVVCVIEMLHHSSGVPNPLSVFALIAQQSGQSKFGFVRVIFGV